MANENFGLSFTIDINDLKSGLKTANKLIQESQSKFKLAAAGLDDWRKSEEGLRAKISSLNSIIGTQQQKVDALKKNYEKLVRDGLDETSDRAIYLRTQINKEEAALESNKAELKKQTDALEDLENQSEETGDEIANVGTQAEKTSGGFSVMKGALADLVADGFRMATQAAKDFVTEMVNVGKTFDDSMAQVAAVSGATGNELETLRNKAKEMGSTTKFTASEAADAFNYMAMAGWKTEDMLGGIEGILNLAAASGSDLATTSDIVTDALTAMGYEAKDAGRLADVMAAASSNANTNVEMMGQTFQYAAPIVGALGYNMEDTAVAIGLMANAGIKGEKAGTALRSILTRLSAPPKEAADAMTALGISITDSNGKMKSLDTVIGDLRKAFANLDEQEAAANAKHLAGQEAMSGLLAIVNAAPADFDKLTTAVEKSDGAAQKMADTMLDTLGGDMTVLNSQIEGVRLTLYEQFAPTLRDIVKKVQKWLGTVDWKSFGKKASDAFKNIINKGKEVAKKILPPLKKAFDVVWKVVKVVYNHFDSLAISIANAVAVMVAFKAAMKIKSLVQTVATFIATLATNLVSATTAQAGLNAVMSANPYGAVATAVGLLAGGVTLLVTEIKKANDPTKSLTKEQKKLKEQADKVKESLNDTTNAYKDLQTEQQKQISAKENEFRYYEDLWDELQGIVDQNGKVKEGYEGRASFIADQLSEATDIEIELVDGVIQKYEELGKTVEDVMQKKRAEILLAGQEELYNNAMENIDAETQKFNENKKLWHDTFDELWEIDRKIAELQEEAEGMSGLDYVGDFFNSFFGTSVSDRYKQLEDQKKLLEESLKTYEDAYNTSEQLIADYTYDIGVYTHNMALAHEGDYDSMIKVTSEYTREFGSMVDAEKAKLQEDITNTRTQLEIKRKTRNEENAKIWDDQIAADEALLVEQVRQLQNYNSTTENMLGENFDIWSQGMSDNLSAITGMNMQFQNAGEGLVQMVVEGQKIGEPMATTEMDTLVNAMLDEIQDGAKDAEKAGKDFVEGVGTGIKNENTQKGVFSSVWTFGKNLLSNLRGSLDEQSPSKATRKMGQYLVDGLNMGIKDKEKNTFKQVSRFGNKVLSTFQDEMSGFGADYDFSGMTTAVGSGMRAHSQSVQGIGNKSVTVNQVNNYSQAHSRYELYKSKQQTAAAVRLALGTV